MECRFCRNPADMCTCAEVAVGACEYPDDVSIPVPYVVETVQNFVGAHFDDLELRRWREEDWEMQTYNADVMDFRSRTLDETWSE